MVNSIVISQNNWLDKVVIKEAKPEGAKDKITKYVNYQMYFLTSASHGPLMGTAISLLLAISRCYCIPQ